jgi:trehalose 6-phosphate synthase
MSRLVVVSNRVAVPGESRAGGLAVGLLAALKERGGLWFGWSGKVTRDPSGTLHEQTEGDIRFVTMDLDRKDHDDYYNGFANRTLWPLLHFRLDLVDYDRSKRLGYRRVNMLFAEKLAPLLRDSDTVWIHDYHLIPLASMLRERGIGCKIGFFLHVPMPSADLVQALPEHQRRMSSLYAYDLVGFQTQRDVERFQAYVRLFGGGKVIAEGELEAPDGHRFRAGAFPISIDTGLIAQQSKEAVNKPAVRDLRKSLEPRQLAIGVDRLDYSKGLPERFHGFERYLERYPKEKGRLTYLQIAPVSRGEVAEYKTLRNQLEQIAGRINGTNAEPAWTPLRYVNRNFPHTTLTGFYRMARIGLVTPLRDGMNLVAKEFVAAQDGADPGVLVLSILAGAASEMKEALIVNPHDLDGVADAIATASSMPLAERRERWRALMDQLQENDIGAWRTRYLQALEAA